MRKIKMGILGIHRGLAYGEVYASLTEEISGLAICETDPEYIEKAKAELPDWVEYYTDYEEFLNSGIGSIFAVGGRHDDGIEPHGHTRKTHAANQKRFADKRALRNESKHEHVKKRISKQFDYRQHVNAPFFQKFQNVAFADYHTRQKHGNGRHTAPCGINHANETYRQECTQPRQTKHKPDKHTNKHRV